MLYIVILYHFQYQIKTDMDEKYSIAFYVYFKYVPIVCIDDFYLIVIINLMMGIEI